MSYQMKSLLPTTATHETRQQQSLSDEIIVKPNQTYTIFSIDFVHLIMTIMMMMREQTTTIINMY